VVVRIDHGLASFLLTSDLTAAGEAALLAARAPLRATVLKVAHHGSRHATTPAFLARVAPRWAVISVGARNAYGHPAPETLARLAASGVALARTDRDGAVLFETDGRELTVTRWASRAVDRLCLEPEGRCAAPHAAAPGAAPAPAGPGSW
jgi:competence protein ComEC